MLDNFFSHFTLKRLMKTNTFYEFSPVHLMHCVGVVISGYRIFHYWKGTKNTFAKLLKE